MNWRPPGDYPVVWIGRGHPYASGSNGWQYMHRWLAMTALGRVLETFEHVHHVDGDKETTDLAKLDILDCVDHGHYHYHWHDGCGREYRSHTFGDRALEVGPDGGPSKEWQQANNF